MIDENLKMLTHMSFKGGTGKTNLNLNLAMEYCSIYPDRRVLFIDADPQANASVFVLGEGVLRANINTLKAAIDSNETLDKLILRSPIDSLSNFDILPSNLKMINLEPILNSRPAKENIFLNYFSKNENFKILKQYDLIIVDLNPVFSTLNLNLMLCCNSVIPVINYGCYSSALNYDSLIETYTDMKKALRVQEDDIKKPVILKYRKQDNSKIKLWLDYSQENRLQDKCFNQKIKESVHYENSILFNKPINVYLREKRIKTDINSEISTLIKEYELDGLL